MVLEIVLAVIIVGLMILLINNFKKLEQAEDIIESQNSYIDKIQEAIIFSEEKIKEIDEREIFKSDDEIGWFFENTKYIQELISNYKIR